MANLDPPRTRAQGREAPGYAGYGVGLRTSLERLAVFRADFGFSDEGMNVTAALGLTF